MQALVHIHPGSPCGNDVLLVTACLCLTWHAAAYGDSSLDREIAASRLDEIVVTGTRPESVRDTPRSVTVITAADIARATSTNLVDLLAQSANVNLRSLFGNDKSAGVDIRGMGDTFVSNVLVLVDGVRINASDLSGADFSSIPLNEIERVEIIRGASAVRYGNGAVGGVINILTRKHGSGLQGGARFNVGSFDSWGSEVSAGEDYKGLNLSARASTFDSKGFRDNSNFAKKDGALQLGYSGLDWLDFYVRAELHHDDYGLPGPISREAFERSAQARSGANRPDDHGETTERRYRAGITLDGEGFGVFKGLASFRSRTNPYVIGYTPLLSLRDQENAIQSRSRDYEGTWTMPFDLLGFSHELVFGYEQTADSYERREGGIGLVDRSHRLVGNTSDRSGFASLHWALPFDVKGNFGYRLDAFSLRQHNERLKRVCDVQLVPTVVDTTVFIEIAPNVFIPFVVPVTVLLPIETNCQPETFLANSKRNSWLNEAWEAGLTWQATDATSFYLGYSQSFRNPNIDELVLATDNLRPQLGKHWELGWRFQPDRRLETSLSFFHMRVADEIFFGFDPVQSRGLNRNLEHGTSRVGVETEIRGRLSPAVSVWTNASYIDARIEGDDTFVPLVPRTKVAAGIEWSLLPRLVMTASCNYVGRRFDGNDFDNHSYRSLDDYHVVDAKLRWSQPHYSAAVSVSNALDAVYATAGYSGTVYPMPPRSVMFELAFEL